MIEYFVEVPDNGIQEPVRTLDDAYPLCYDLAQDFGYAEVCWYALNGKRVTEGSYSDKDLKPESPKGDFFVYFFLKKKEGRGSTTFFVFGDTSHLFNLYLYYNGA